MADATELLTYQVTISQLDSVSRAWWQIGNVGTPAQVAAALSELAGRCAREPTAQSSAARRWYVCDVRTSDGVPLDYFVGVVRATHLPERLRDVVARILELTSPDSCGEIDHPLTPHWGAQ
jgi:hypothetical protein